MAAGHLNEHDANQGAQSTGEFLGMAGNSGWWLLGSAGASLLLVIFLWGVLGVSLLLCLFLSVILCGLSVTYVFALKNNRPNHYDTDFFESVLVEAGVTTFEFGPRNRKLANPFAELNGRESELLPPIRPSSRKAQTSADAKARAARPRLSNNDGVVSSGKDRAEAATENKKTDVAVSESTYLGLQEHLTEVQDQLEEALAERGEE
jgi:hypothetical protein